MKNISSKEIHDKVRSKYCEMSFSIKDRFKYITGKEGALKLGYDAAAVKSIPAGIVESFCGVGNPFSLGLMAQREIILDVGCGGGFDLIYARSLAVPQGIVYGIDLVPAMVDKARRNITEAGLSGCEVQLAGSESIPHRNGFFDTVISNGAIYLSPLKDQTFLEICRVLKPGGRLLFADVVLNDDLPEKISGCFDGWSG